MVARLKGETQEVVSLGCNAGKMVARLKDLKGRLKKWYLDGG